MKTTFENFCPRLKAGRIIPQGRRMVYETADGKQQIVLPIEIADAILLSTGAYTMRQIIEKIFKRKGGLHFRTLFKAIHQLCDHGFFENGDELESHSWWTSPGLGKESFVRDRLILKPRHGSTLSPLRFYFLSLLTLALAGLSLVDVSWPLIDPASLNIADSTLLSLVCLWLLNSLILSAKNILKLVYQTLLTGTVFGMHLRLSPWGLFLKTIDEPVFLITNPLFLCLYHFGLVFSTLFVVWPLVEINVEIHQAALSLAFLQIVFDFSPFSKSEFMRSMRAMLSLSDSDLVAGYLKDNSLLSLLEPVGQPSLSMRLRRWFQLYNWVWSAGMLTMAVAGCRLVGELASQNGFSLYTLEWFGYAGIGFWVLQHVADQSKNTFKRVFIVKSKLLVLRLRKWRDSAWPHDRLMDALLQLPLFSYFSTGLLEKVLLQSEMLKVRVGSRLITQGEIGKHLFVLLDGSLGIERSSVNEGRKPLNSLRPVSIFGEMAIVEESERTADVVAKEDSTVLKIPATVLRSAASQSQYMREIEAFCNAIIVNQFFTSAPMFRHLPHDVIHDITMRSSLKRLTNGEVVIRQGEPGRSFFMILRGSVEVGIDGQVIKRIRQGGFVGEISLIADIPRTATVRAHEPTIVLEMAASSFWEVLSQNIELAMFVEAVGESRLNEDLQSSAGEPDLSRTAG